MGQKIDSSPLFSIIIPIYNVEAYIKDCIESILQQEYNDYEVWLIDDGSTDHSGKLCDDYAEKYHNIYTIHQSNQGLSGARNTGIRCAQGKYLVYVDSDDMMALGALQSLKQVIYEQRDPSIILSRRITYVSEKVTTECQYYFDKVKLFKLSPAQIYSALQKLPDMWLGVWVITTKREYIIKNKFYFYDGIFHEDEEWVPKIFFNADRIGYNNECVYVNRVNRVGSITSTPNIKREFDKLKIIELLQNEFTTDKYSTEICEVVAERVRNIYFGTLCTMNTYINDAQFPSLVKEMDIKKQLLRNAIKSSYKFGNVLVMLFGVRRAGKILGMIKKWMYGV